MNVINKYKVLKEEEIAGDSKAVDSVVELNEEDAAPMVEAGELELSEDSDKGSDDNSEGGDKPEGGNNSEGGDNSSEGGDDSANAGSDSAGAEGGNDKPKEGEKKKSWAGNH